jgi:tetratricopeptide (TPR) repeat protein
VKVPFQLRRLSRPEPVTGLLLTSHEVPLLLALCAKLDLSALPSIYRTALGFLVALDGPAPRFLPETIRLRSLAPGLWLPADAELVPSLLDDEIKALARRRGLLFLPGGRVLAFDLEKPLRASSLIQRPPMKQTAWKSLPEPPRLAAQLTEITIELPPRVEELLEPGNPATGGEPIEGPGGADSQAARDHGAEVAGLSATLFEQARLGAGRALMSLGQFLHLKGLASTGANWIQKAVEEAPHLVQRLLGDREASLRALLRMFREGRLEQALRRAVNFAEPGERAPTTPYGRLPFNWLGYSLENILGKPAVGSWLAPYDVVHELQREYHKAAQVALRDGDHRRAAFIYGKLLRDYRLAAHALSQGGLHRDAAILYLKKVGAPLDAARAFAAAGDTDRAIALYRREHDHVSAGDLLRQIGEEDAALAEYHRAAQDIIAKRQDYLAAGDLILQKAGRADVALTYFETGWAGRPGRNALECALRSADLYATEQSPKRLIGLVSQAEAYLKPRANHRDVGRFFNAIARLAERPNLAPVADDLRDRALMAIADALRRQADTLAPTPPVVTDLLGLPGPWPASLVDDAHIAIRTQRQRTEPAKRKPSEVQQLMPARPGGRGVTAVAFTVDGDVFQGRASGTAICFRRSTGTTFPLPSSPGSVESLAVDADGELVAALRVSEDHRYRLAVCQREGSMYQLVEERVVDGSAPLYLAPQITNSAGIPECVIWSDESVTLLHGKKLVPHALFPVHLAAGDPVHILLLPAKSDDGGRFLLWFTSDSVWYWKRRRYESAFLGWSPGITVGGARRPPPSVSLAWQDNTHLELAAIGGRGTLYWSLVEITPERLQNVQTRASDHSDRYTAGTLVRCGLAAGVHKNGIDWLRCGVTGMRLLNTTATPLPEIVACHADGRGDELLLVGRNGSLHRVSVPI